MPLLPPPASHLLHLNDHTVAFADAAGRNVSCYRLSLNDVADFNRWHVNGAQPVLDGLCDPLLSLWHLSRTPRAVVHHEVLALKHYPQPVVVLQVRGGDKLAHEVAGGGYTFEPALDKLAANASLRGGTCVVLGDDSAMGATAAEAAIRLLNCQVVNRIEPAYQHFQDNFTREGPVSKCWRTEKLLADIEIMAASDAALVLMASNVARIAVLLRECRRPGALREVLDWQGHNVLFEACLAA